MLGGGAPQTLVPSQGDFHDAYAALTTNRSTGRINVGRGARIPYFVRGESHYQQALAYLRQYASPDGQIPALLVREPSNRYDANAVAVMIYGHVVGYLGRDDAADLAPNLDELAEDGQFLVCPARLVGGTPDKPTIGVVVELRDASERVR